MKVCYLHWCILGDVAKFHKVSQLPLKIPCRFCNVVPSVVRNWLLSLPVLEHCLDFLLVAGLDHNHMRITIARRTNEYVLIFQGYTLLLLLCYSFWEAEYF